ncbi:MAG: ribosome small subunit-dependent GTPase A [Acutalibacteraceae bacterium]|nr:ribosome small subunit-dependent GTPase A [Acutalibacteraceae bacterium]
MAEVCGIIVRLLGGFYYVETDNEMVECKARGIFRKKGLSPMVGDRVRINIPKEGYASIEEIFPRKNKIIRPAIANIDKLVIVSSVCEPEPNLFIIDKMTATAISKGIEPVIVFSKTDLEQADKYHKIYENSKITTISFSTETGEGAEDVRNLLKDSVVAFTGNSGVGKSSLLNYLFPQLNIETGNISKKLGRGRHTTRSIELYKTDGGYVADTPGFSTVDLERYELIDKEELAECFPEFEEYLNTCQFTSCAHVCEKGCTILQAVKDGTINKSRHNSYVEMYNEVKDIKEWQKK